MRALIFGPLLAAGSLCLTLAEPAAAGEVIVVKITDLVFSPAAVKAKAGDTIEWVNEDLFDHTATANDESFDLAIPVGQSARLEVKQPGAVPYYCRIHPNMKGTIDIE